MKILVINSGSSSVKFRLFDMRTERALAKGSIGRNGCAKSEMSYSSFNAPETIGHRTVPDHKRAIGLALELLTHRVIGVIKDTSEIRAVGHRVVHGGERFTGSAIINGDIIKAIRSHFDPEIVDCFLKREAVFKRIKLFNDFQDNPESVEDIIARPNPPE